MRLLTLFAFLLGMFTFNSCSDDDAADTTPDYHVHIHSPNTDNKHVGDEITVKIDFEDHNGGTVHHVKVRMYDKTSGNEVWNEPTDAHVHETSGKFTFEKVYTLNVDPNTDWVIEAKVWGHEDGVGEVSETLEFHVHP